MAEAVNFRHFTPENSREDLARRIHDIPTEHADALLAAVALLQKCHDAGLLSLASGLISAGNSIIDHAADVADSPQAVTALRTALIFGNILNTLDPDELQKAVSVKEKDISICRIVRGVLSKEMRVVAMIGINLMNVIGKAFAKLDAA
jgi:uncharacterized protein YjgD (DUF1641 family)